MLVEHGADAKAMDDVSTSHLLFRLMMYGRTPLHYACHTGRIMVVLMLLEHGVDAKAQNKVNTSLFPINLPLLGGRAPLHYACYNGHVKVVETLLEHGVDAEAKDERGETAFDAGRRRGHANRLEPVFAAHEARLAQLFAWLPPLPSPPPSLETTAAVVVSVEGWLRPLLPEQSTTHPLPHLDAFISGAIKRNSNLAAMVTKIQNTIDEAPPEFPALNWPAFKATITRALGVLDQAVQVPEALQGCLSQLDPNIDNLESSTLGARLRTVLGPNLPASLILEAMTEVDQGLTLSSLGQLDLHYNQNHKVYKARAALPESEEQDLAVKEYAFARQHKQDQCRTFLRELRAMRQLEHPHIIPVLGALVDVHSGHPSAYLVQPWCTQGDLQQWLGKARHLATSTVVASLMTQLRMALAFMHSKGLVHRDVKLSNVMLDGDEDQPVMCDSSSDLYKETRALLATDPKQRPSLFSARNIAQQPALAQVGPAIDVLRDAPELMSEVGELLKQLNTDGREPANIAVQRVERVHNPVLWERYSVKRREMLHRIKSQEQCTQIQTATSDAPSGSPALLRDTSCQERLLLHGIAPDTMLRDKIVRLGLDYRFAGNSAGHRFGLGVYLADHPGKSHQYAGAGPNGERMLVITRALLGHAHVHPSPPSGALAPPLLPNAPNNERYDSVVATPSGQFHEVIVFENAQIYPELVYGRAPLHYACEKGHVKVVEMLLKHGVDAKARDDVSASLFPYLLGMYGRTAVHYACDQVYVKVLEMLVEHGADAKAMDDVSTSHLLFRLMMYGRTPLHYACHTGRIMVVLMLLEHGVDAKAQNKVNTSLFPINLPLLGGRAPLHYACYNGHVKVVETLLEHGVDAEAKDELLSSWDPRRIRDAAATLNRDILDGWTALHCACLRSHVKVVEVLLKHGVDAEAQTNVSTSSSLPFTPI
ncbi:uncharacterized protein MONBRDRAFT_30435 [Monosiga brevicollis MX1]|uniref:Protein kinase domain-containing protein n=1 Tax=Monosiga brevicollis TaxID=81824 RepID=A9VDY2_MONBE|nr:uncharacterized protein MONBRDRAFT_30435 [Monosiga brevicollis MX1]EDQ84253.1 predicted protein [Monosiga brevicollis MX1]|eukprot:XP_001750928.1 hypothetical protein [Monosiga brevicollis MX1]